MDGSDFHTVASELANGDSEAHWRSAISRAYYGAFHVARQAIENKGGHVGRGSEAHGKVPGWLLNRPEEVLIETGSNLRDLHADRIRADYHLEDSKITQNDAVLKSIMAKIIIEKIRVNL